MKPSEGAKFCQRYSPVPLMSWQLDILRGIFAHRFNLIVLPSGFFKTGMAALTVGAHLVCEKRKLRSFGIAGDLDQAGLLHEALTEIFEHPDLRRLIVPTQWKISLKHGAKSVHETLATHVPSVWGRTPALLVVDELAEATAQSEKAFFATVSALRKTRDSKLIIITSPSLRDVTAHKILEAVRGDPLWNVVELTSDDVAAPWLDAESESVYAALLPREIREAKHKGIWTDPEGGVLDRAKIEAVFTADLPEASGTEARGVDLAISRDQAVVARVQKIESMYSVVGLHAWTAPRGGKIDLTEIQEEIVLMNRQGSAPWVFDPWQSQLMMQQLRKAGVPVVEFTFSHESRRKLFSRVLDLIESGRLKSRPHPELKKQLLGLSVKKLPSGAWRIDHRPGQRDDLIVAVGLALDALPEYAGDAAFMGGVGTRASGAFVDFIDAPLSPWPVAGRTRGADW